MTGSAITSITLLTLFFIIFGTLIIVGIDRGITALQEFEGPTIKRLKEAHACEIADLKRSHKDRVARLAADNSQLRRDFDHAVIDCDWAHGMLQDQTIRNQGRIARHAHSPFTHKLKMT